MTKGSVEGNCSPLTTFVRTDTNTFREIVQRLTGPPDQTCDASASTNPGSGAIGSTNSAGMKRPTASSSGTNSLFDRRQYNRNKQKLQIVKPPTRVRSMGSFSADLHSLTASPGLTPTSNFSKLSLALDSDDPTPPFVLDVKEEDKAIKERRFYLHPSPRSRTQASQPELLDLFPLVSPREVELDRVNAESRFS